MGIVGWILTVIGIVCVLLGMIGGARDMFRRQNEPGAQAALPTEVVKVIGKIVEAPTFKMFFGGRPTSDRDRPRPHGR